MLMQDPEDEAFGPICHGCSTFLLPGMRDGEELKRSYLETMRSAGYPFSDNPSDFEDPNNIYQGPHATGFLSSGRHSLIQHPIGGEHSAQLISALLHTYVCLVEPLGKAMIWTYVLYRDGHMVDRHASCPEWIPSGYLGDLDFDEYERIHGREKALREYMATWAGRTELISKLFEAPLSEVQPYLRQFTLSELGDWGQLRKKYADHKARADDRYSIASPWVLVHFVERLGFKDFRDVYFDVNRGRPFWSASPVYSPAQYKDPSLTYPRPLCVRDPFPFGGFFRNHEAVCGSP